MQEKSTYNIFLKFQRLEVPTNFPFLSNVNLNILQSLVKSGQYTVKSDVSEEVLQSFLNNWVTNDIPDINPENFSEFDKLSQEFERMKDLIQIFKNNSSNSIIFRLITKNRNLKKQLSSRKCLLKEKVRNDKKIIEYLFHSATDEISLISRNIADDLFYFCSSGYVYDVYLVTRRKIKQNGLIFALDDEDNTAGIYNSKVLTSDVVIPRSIIDESTNKEFIITSIYERSFQCSSIKSLSFADDSEVRFVYQNAFFNSGIESIAFPSSLIELKDGWCYHAMHLKNVSFKTQNPLFSCFDNKLIIGKSSMQSDNYDVLHFARRDIEDVVIPSFIKKISPYAFNFCLKLNKVEFQKNSELLTIEKGAFSESYLQSITLPSHVRAIHAIAFYICRRLKKVEFENNESELVSIERNAFADSRIEELTLPSNITYLSEGWCNDMSWLKSIKIIPYSKVNIAFYNEKMLLGKSDLKSDNFDILLFVLRNATKITIPSFIKHVSSHSTSLCTKLKSVEFDENSELDSIGKFAFHSLSVSSIKIPKNVTCIDKNAFYLCRFLKRIDFHEQSKLIEIGCNAFSFSSIQCIIIPSSVKTIHEHAFTNCRSLKIVEILEDSKLVSSNKEYFANSTNVVIMIPVNLRKSLHFKVSKPSNLFNSFAAYK